MIPQSFRKFGSTIVYPGKGVCETMKELNDTHACYRTEGIVYRDSFEHGGHRKIYEIFYSYVDNFSLDGYGSDEEYEELEESSYGLYEVGIEPNHSN